MIGCEVALGVERTDLPNIKERNSRERFVFRGRATIDELYILGETANRIGISEFIDRTCRPLGGHDHA